MLDRVRMVRGHAVDQVINELASKSCSIVHARELRDAGISYDAVAHRKRSGWMQAVIGRSFAVGPQCRNPTYEMRCMAAVRHAGPAALLDGSSAATLRGVWDRDDGSIVVSTLCTPPRTQAGYTFHRRHADVWTPQSTRDDSPVPMVDPGAMCLRTALTLTKWQVAFVISRSIYERLLRLDELEAYCGACTRVPGVSTLRSAIELVRFGSVGSRSTAEDMVLEDIVLPGLPEPLVNVRGALGLSRDEPDLYYVERRLNIEVDGRHHDLEPQWSDDRRRDADVAMLGIPVVRIPARLVYRQRARVKRTLLRLLHGGDIRVDPVTRRIVLD